ncbi:MAG: hypothetical protein M0R80_25830, partial [Proteobacteria bacterium]|nr:hypothetical protein [Pseudomonadota bacterium]
IYFTDYSDPENTEISNFDFAHPGKLVAYDGKLTKEDFAKYAQTISGHFSVFYHEKDLLAKARPYQWSGTGLVRELHNGRWPYCAVEVPKELLGKKVIIQVVEE